MPPRSIRLVRGMPVVVLVLATILAAPRLPAQEPPTAVAADTYGHLRWRNVGPARGGRVTAVAGIRTQPCTFYMGSSGGGVWKTENCGGTWRPVSDGQIATGSIGAIDVSESDPAVVYVGTGSAAIRSNVIIGRGMYGSRDDGRTWQFLGLGQAGQIGSVVVHPSRPEVVWVAALGSPFGPNRERGVFKTTDGGRTWRHVLFVNEETGARVVAVNRSAPNEVYAGMHRAARKGWDIVSGGPATEGGIYRSADGGDTWTRLATGLPQVRTGRIDIDIARSDPRVVYAMIEAPGEEGGLYRSQDAGASWRLVSNDPKLRARPFYFHYVDVNPKDANEVWVSELRLWKSSDGGTSFTAVATSHGDNHGIWFNPDDPRIAIQGNDGGASVTLDGGASWSSILNQPTAELYMVTVDEQFPYRLYGPQQDNSTVIVPSLPPVAWPLDRPEQVWGHGPGCETGQIQPRSDGQVVYGACKGEFGRYSVATGQEKHYWVYPQNRYGHHPRDIRYRFPRQSVIVVSPHDERVIYHASHVVHRTRDEGVSWEVISPDLTANEPDKQVLPGNPITRDVTGEEVYSSIYAMAESRLERGVLWVGANDGPVHVSRDDGRTWKDVTPPDLPPGGRVQTIEDSPHRRGSVYIAVYRYLREHDLRPYIYATNDYGTTWTRLADGRNGIPDDHPTRVVREDPDVEGLLYAGSEFGVFVSFDGGRRWQSLQQNLPATPVTDIRVHRKDLVISTMGRAFWIMDDVSALQQVARALLVAAGHSAGAGASDSAREVGRGADDFDPERPFLFQPRPAHRMRYEPVAPDPGWPEYPPSGAPIDYYLPAAFAGEPTLEVLDAAGGIVRTFPSGSASTIATVREMSGRRLPMLPATAASVRPGTNRLVWDLRHAGAWSSKDPTDAVRGPLVAPGQYRVRLTAGRYEASRIIEVRPDPRVTADGVTQADLEEQTVFLLKVRDAISDARRLAFRIDGALDGRTGPLRAGAPELLRALRDRLVTAGGPYARPMLIDQLANVAKMLAQADQRIGDDARERFDDLLKELSGIEPQVEAALR
jgi:photosystem II stability/assembly factor-like uncharacterized protein